MKQSRSLFLGAAILAVAVTASASQFDPFDRASQVRSSDAVVVGTVMGLSSHWTPDRSAIVTDVEIEVEESWKGRPEQRITVHTLGGAVGNVMLRVDGAATFREGERVVLFLERDGDGWVPAGMRFGKYDLAGATDDPFVIGSLPPATPGAPVEPVSMSLDELRGEVLGVVGR